VEEDVNVYYEEINIKAPELRKPSMNHEDDDTPVLESLEPTGSPVTPEPAKLPGWKPYTLRDYKAQMQVLKHSNTGSLGPNTQGEEYNNKVQTSSQYSFLKLAS
jgi:hypothetical protein